MCTALFFFEMVKGFSYIHFAGAYWKWPAPTGGETLEWLGSRMMYDCSAWLPNKSHIVGFNLDLDFQLLPTDSWEWRRMIRSLWAHPHLTPSKLPACYPRPCWPVALRISSVAIGHPGVFLMLLALCCDVRSVYANSLCLVCTFIPMIVLLYLWN